MGSTTAPASAHRWRRGQSFTKQRSPRWSSSRWLTFAASSAAISFSSFRCIGSPVVCRIRQDCAQRRLARLAGLQRMEGCKDRATVRPFSEVQTEVFTGGGKCICRDNNHVVRVSQFLRP